MPTSDRITEPYCVLSNRYALGAIKNAFLMEIDEKRPEYAYFRKTFDTSLSMLELLEEILRKDSDREISTHPTNNHKKGQCENEQHEESESEGYAFSNSVFISSPNRKDLIEIWNQTGYSPEKFLRKMVSCIANQDSFFCEETRAILDSSDDPRRRQVILFAQKIAELCLEPLESGWSEYPTMFFCGVPVPFLYARVLVNQYGHDITVDDACKFSELIRFFNFKGWPDKPEKENAESHVVPETQKHQLILYKGGKP